MSCPNPTPGSKWTASRPGVQETFVERVAAHGVAVTVRDTRGREIDGSALGLMIAIAAASGTSKTGDLTAITHGYSIAFTVAAATASSARSPPMLMRTGTGSKTAGTSDAHAQDRQPIS